MVFVGRFFSFKNAHKGVFFITIFSLFIFIKKIELSTHLKGQSVQRFQQLSLKSDEFSTRRKRVPPSSSLEITRQLNRSHSALLRISSLWSKEGIQHRRPGSGRSKRTNEREDRRLRQLSVRHRFRPSAEMEWIG
jgi:hypothetical protein